MKNGIPTTNRMYRLAARLYSLLLVSIGFRAGWGLLRDPSRYTYPVWSPAVFGGLARDASEGLNLWGLPGRFPARWLLMERAAEGFGRDTWVLAFLGICGTITACMLSA